MRDPGILECKSGDLIREIPGRATSDRPLVGNQDHLDVASLTEDIDYVIGQAMEVTLPMMDVSGVE